ncbi:uncharacterized protein LOC110734905 [Chenopodium quinoa]|uniref:uncharacterized protein LOC110734905 n=1 Tax=Chenopodium quinoa TaxID=63459 RepID=UPI000B77A1DD|nr:uncharacterized protein LOC110734905 [Chenopodium quinoa]
MVLLIMDGKLVQEMSSTSFSPSKEKKCKCGVPFAKLTSWTRENPGRKFRTCKFYDPVTESRGCKAFEWVDEQDGTAWQTEVINNLLLDKKLLKGEISDYKREVDDLGGQLRCLLNEVDRLKMKCKALNSDRNKMNREMHGRNARSDHSVLSLAVGISLCLTKLAGKALKQSINLTKQDPCPKLKSKATNIATDCSENTTNN